MMKRIPFFMLGLITCAAIFPAHAQQTAIAGAANMQTASAAQNATEESLREGHVTLRGMVRPTKGGYQIAGAIVEQADLEKALGAAGKGEKNQRADWFLGAVVQIDGELRKHATENTSTKDGIYKQQRSGDWFAFSRVSSAKIITPAQTIEGPLARSKGLFAIAGHLVSRDDLAWSLASVGEKEGLRVRLYGQPRTVVCRPNEQCLIGGQLPLFDVARAERLH